MTEKIDSNNQISQVDSFEIDKNIEEPKPEQSKKKSVLKFFLYFLFIIIATGIALFLSLYKDFDGVINSLKQADWRYLLLIAGIVFLTYFIDGFTIFVFARLYTRRYKYHQGVATSFVGAFYSDITPGASGGQIMQVYTMKKQGIQPSSAASIMVMSFIVYQICLIIIGIFGLFFSGGLIASVGTFDITVGNTILHIPAIPLTIAGFILNLLVILGLFLMSFSHGFHNFIMHYGIGLLGKLRILRHPDKTRESLRVQVENFKIELRRLCSNIPVFILMIICFSLILILRFSIPYFAGLALNGYGYRLNMDGSLMIQTIYDSRGGVMGHMPIVTTGQPDIASFWQGVFLSSYHQMATGLIPIPGAAGVSEYFFNTIFQNYFTSQQVTTAAQIIWRFSTFHIILLFSGIFSATYRASPKNEVHHANRKTFVTLQYETYADRKASADTMFETSSISLKEIQSRLKRKPKENVEVRDIVFEEQVPQKNVKPIKEKKVKPVKEKPVKIKKEKKSPVPSAKWDEIEIGED